MNDLLFESPSPYTQLEKCQLAYLAFLKGDDAVGAEWLEEMSMVDGTNRSWDFVRSTLWNCSDRLPESCWKRFQFASETPVPVCFAYAVRREAMGPLLMGFLEMEKYGAISNLYGKLLHGLEGPF